MQVDTPSSDALSPAAIDVASVIMGSVLIASNPSAIMSSTVQVQGTKRLRLDVGGDDSRSIGISAGHLSNQVSDQPLPRLPHHQFHCHRHVHL